MYKEVLRGMMLCSPLLLGLIPVGFIMGAQASHVGQSAITTMLMTSLNLAGGSEFAALGLWQAIPPIIMITFTTFLINSRHIVMGLTFAPHLKHEKGYILAFIYFFMVDEIWALTMQDIQRRNQLGLGFSLPCYIGMILAICPAWVISAFSGNVVGNIFGDLSAYGFAVALPATFMCLAIGMRPRVKALGAKILAYTPIVLSFLASGLTAVFGTPNYSVGAGVLVGLSSALLLQIIKEKRDHTT